MLMPKAGSTTAVPPIAPRTRWRGPGVSPSRAADSRQRPALLGPSTPGLLDQNANEAERCAEYNLSPFFPKLLLFISPFPCRLFLFLCSLSLSDSRSSEYPTPYPFFSSTFLFLAFLPSVSRRFIYYRISSLALFCFLLSFPLLFPPFPSFRPSPFSILLLLLIHHTYP